MISKSICKVTLRIGVWDDGVDKLTTRCARRSTRVRYGQIVECWRDANSNEISGDPVRVEDAKLEDIAEFLALETGEALLLKWNAGDDAPAADETAALMWVCDDCDAQEPVVNDDPDPMGHYREGDQEDCVHCGGGCRVQAGFMRATDMTNLNAHGEDV